MTELAGTYHLSPFGDSSGLYDSSIALDPVEDRIRLYICLPVGCKADVTRPLDHELNRNRRAD